MTDFEKVIDFDNMYRAFRKAKCGKGHKKSAARFNLAALDGIHTLITQLKDKTYRVSDYTEFKVYEPKERVIQTTAFKDKVIQHSLCDNVIMPRLQRVFIPDNCAGQIGKGTLYGLDRLSEKMAQFHKRYGMKGYILKCDISKFFYNISHDQLKDIVHYHFGRRVLDERIAYNQFFINCAADPEKSYPESIKFCKALDMAIAALREQEGRKWISVSERLPEDDPNVKKHIEGERFGFLTVLAYNGVVKQTNRFFCNEARCGLPKTNSWEWASQNVTHWMPLPEPPKD